ncbi:MAG: hypothetical protein GAK35_02202 [Herbaspirillum frisingense]|uniref:EexN family lipoprotein n=1 Tax=Herbaspirillum frisingense TaxID=92645 RepID=A0A7V8JUD5_9BURK|nr:MAG: hypothetical protein GAK35_02202 [Herbaspirillum frisingense]
MMPSHKAHCGLLIAFLTLFMTACSSNPPVTPPSDLLNDCPHAAAPDRTNAGLANYVKAEQDALDNCNADKAALRAWASKISPAS